MTKQDDMYIVLLTVYFWTSRTHSIGEISDICKYKYMSILFYIYD